MSQTAIARIWKAFALQPHRIETFKLSNDPLFIDKVRDIVGLYLNPPERALVLCVDEKSQIQALDRTAAAFCRCVRASPSGARTTTCATARRRCSPRWMSRPAKSSANCIAGIASASSCSSSIRSTRRCPAALDVHLILDNYGTHKTPRMRRWFARHPRFHVHFTPTSASWLNLVERWFATLTEKQIKRGAHRSTRALEAAIREYLTITTRRRSPSSGPRPLTRSSPRWPDFVSESPTRDTST